MAPGLPYQNVHQHIVGPYPHATTELGARVAAFRVAEFARRVMLYFDFQMIKRRIPMAQVRNEDGSINFFPANSWEFMAFHDSILARLNDTISGRVSGEETHVISKSGTVGLRTRHFYDGEVLGIEVRYLSARLPKEETARALARAQDAMTSGRFFLSEQESTGFFHELGRRGAHLPKSVQLLHYGSDFNHRLARSSLTPELSELVERAAEKNDFVKMLLHDWKHDPLFYNRPDRLEQIRKAQEDALMLLSHGMKATEVMQIFVKKSGLAHEIEGFFIE